MRLSLHLLPVAIFLLGSSLYGTTLAEGTWTKSKYKIAGSWKIEETADGTFLSFSEDFKTKKAPDLKVAFNPKAFADVSAKNALLDALIISELKTYKGAVSIQLPDDLRLDAYQSLIIHCEQYSILWGGADL
tara:strand:- start:1174 stop:1569 length:396 start_codon:yes stop_codon:yes gene_type:complete